ncbi:MAG: hypothetical protein ACXWC5_27525, partial [Burkholderiales bacterium]
SSHPEVLDDWEFFQESDGRWFWRNVTPNGANVSVQKFTSFVEVIASAVQQGFQPGVSRIATVRADRRFKPRSSSGSTREIH